MNPETRIDKLAEYYNHPLFAIKERYGWSFEEFVAKVDSGEYARVQASIKSTYIRKNSRSQEDIDY